jgi:hypothetical protein
MRFAGSLAPASKTRGFVMASTAVAADRRHAAPQRVRRNVRPTQRRKAMSQRSKFKKCAWCGNPFPVVEGRVLQWRVDGEQFACNEFCAEGVEQEPAKPAAS